MITDEAIQKRAKEIGDRLVHPTVIAFQQGLAGQNAVMAPSANFRMMLYAALFPLAATTDVGNGTFLWYQDRVNSLLFGMAKEELQREITENPNIN